MKKATGREKQLREGSAKVFRDVWKTSQHYYVHSLGEAVRYSQVIDLFKCQWLEGVFPKTRGLRSLECGCGSAGVSAYFAERGYEAIFLDFTDTGISKARESFGRYRLPGQGVQGDVMALPFRESSFDVVSSFGLLEHFEAPERAIHEMARVLRPGGTFFAEICPKKISVQTLANLFVNGLAAFTYWTLHGQPLYGFRRGIRKAFSSEDFYETTYPASRYAEAALEAGVARAEWVSANPFPDVYLPPSLMPRYVRWLKAHRKTWFRFVGPKSGAAFHWNRFWYLWGQKGPTPFSQARLSQEPKMG
jgi:ubiquinone/menaquinone biosynthesis C-methylase UbiE